MRFRLAFLLFAVYLLNLFVYFHSEDGFNKEDGCYDAEHAKGVGCGVAHRHGVDSFQVGCGLLSCGKSGGVGHGTRHDAHQSVD